MDTGCFTAAQRISCHAMNADIFKPVPERGAHQASAAAAKTSKNKADQPKPELAQVVTDSKTGRSYSKGKLLGKVRFIFGFKRAFPAFDVRAGFVFDPKR